MALVGMELGRPWKQYLVRYWTSILLGTSSRTCLSHRALSVAPVDAGEVQVVRMDHEILNFGPGLQPLQSLRDELERGDALRLVMDCYQ